MLAVCMLSFAQACQGMRAVVLWDAENVNPGRVSCVTHVMSRAHLHHVVLRKAFGCHEQDRNPGRAALASFGFDCVVSPARHTKNAVDIQITIEAMRLLCSHCPLSPSLFIIVSSDSDFHPLVRELRRRGKTVWGFGYTGSTSPLTRGVYDHWECLEHSTTKRA